VPSDRRTEALKNSSFTLALALLLGAGAVWLPVAPARAQGAPDSTAAPAARPADAVPAGSLVRIEGRVVVDSSRIVSTFGVPVGQPYDARVVQAGLRRLWATRLFDDLEVLGRTTPSGVELTLRVAERPRVSSVIFTGAEHFKQEDLSGHVGFRAGDGWRPELLSAGRDSLLAKYKDDGYRDTQVKASADSTSAGMLVRYEIEEKEKARVTAIRFEGESAFDEGELKKHLASKKKGFPFRSGTVKEEKLAEDLEKLRTFYRERGYRDVRVERLPFAPDPKNKGLVLAYQVTEGPLYRVGEVRWQGNEAIATPVLESMSRGIAGQVYNGTRIRGAVESAYSAYAEEGRLYLSIDPTEIVRDSNVVDVAYQVTENAPSHVRQVRIVGNTYTKENVIRRELELREGDLFRRSRLIASRENVFRLGYFQDVVPDLQAADSLDVDIVMKVAEKQTGTASAGAGYSSDGGLTGFLNLGHNNLFGNGQAVSVQLERGGSRKAVDLSFTDPWFRNTPLTLGASAFITDREIGTNDIYTDYSEKRRGFTLQIGRPLPWIAYTRGLVRYRLEGVEIEVPDSTNATPQILALRTQGETITSSMEFALSRNNQNHPTYPNRGQRVSFTSEFAGGPLGGDYDFNKTRLDARWYAKSVIPKFATMFRVRLGSLSAYDESGTVPVYERFRLGGITYDALRGYDDYSVVPRDNETFPRYANGASVTPGSFPRVEVPYPGGNVFTALTLEQQFPIVSSVHGVMFLEGGDVWNRWGDVRLFDLRKSAGVGLRVEVPILGNVGFDYAYGFDRRRPGWKGHFLLGSFNF
jgi:outer membrane protein insertion porin family